MGTALDVFIKEVWFLLRSILAGVRYLAATRVFVAYSWSGC